MIKDITEDRQVSVEKDLTEDKNTPRTKAHVLENLAQIYVHKNESPEFK